MARFLVIAAKHGRPITTSELARVRPDQEVLAPTRTRPDLAVFVSFDSSWEPTPTIHVDSSDESAHQDQGSLALVPQRQDSKTPLPAELLGKTIGPFSLPRPFAAVAWDSRRVRVIADELAGRPVWYYEAAQTVIVASSPALILNHPHVHIEPNLSAIAERLAYRMSSHTQSVYDGFQQLPPGHSLEVSANGIVRTSQWHAFDYSPSSASPNEAAEEANRLTTKSLSAELSNRSTSEVALHLSGGLDSAALAGIIKQLGFDSGTTALMRRYPNLPNDESRFQEAVLQGSNFKTKIHRPTPFDIENDLVELIRSSKVPVLPADPARESSSKWAAANGIKSEITGVGGDEIFAEIDGSLLSHLQSKQWSSALAILRGTSPRRIAASHLEFAPEIVRQWRTRYRPWLGASLANEDLLPLETKFVPSFDGRAKRRMQWLLGGGWFSVSGELSEQLNCLRRTEPVNPFLNRDLVQWALKTPDWYRSVPSDARFIQRKAFWAILPKEIRERRGKVHFDYQMALDLGAPEVLNILGNLEIAKAGFVNQEIVSIYADQLIRATRANIRTIPPLAGPLWAAIGMEIWWRQTFGAES